MLFRQENWILKKSKKFSSFLIPWFLYSGQKRTLFRQEKWNFKRSQKSEFARSWFFSTSRIFSHGYVFGKLDQKRLLFGVSDRMRMLFRPENWSFEKVQKNRNFPKWLVYGSFRKVRYFLMGIFWAN